jgi:hypothetical protein
MRMPNRRRAEEEARRRAYLNRTTSFDLEEDEIVGRLRAAGYLVYDWSDESTNTDAAHFGGTQDLIVPRDRAAHRALMQAIRNEPIDPP